MSGKARRPTHVVVDLDFLDQVEECFVDVDALLCGGLDEAAAEVLSEVSALCVRQKEYNPSDSAIRQD